MTAFDAVLAIPTYRRPRGLERLLASLRPSLDRHRVQVVVGDNACDAETRAVVTAFGHAHMTYLPVPERGISQNRNALLAAFRAAPHAPWLGMLDDDLIVPPDWLDQMLAVARRHDADVTGGPYRIDIAQHRVGRLVRNSILLNRPNPATGPIDVFHAGGNMLLSRRLILRQPLAWFDTALGRSGGEDCAFLTRAQAQGARFAWSAEALCLEDFPIERATARYVLGRYYSTGNSMAHIDLAEQGRGPVLARVTRRLAASIARAGANLLRRDIDATIRRMLDATWALGAIAGALGLARIERYR